MSKREQVIEAARDLFTHYGYKRVSMDEIARKSGVTKKTIYSYFEDKDDLLRHLILERIAAIQQLVQELHDSPLPVKEKTHKIIFGILQYQKNDALLKQLQRESVDVPAGNAKKWHDFVNQTVLKEVRSILDSAVKKGFLKKCDTKLLSFAIYKLYFALVFEYDGKLDEKQAAEITDFINHGLIKEAHVR